MEIETFILYLKRLCFVHRDKLMKIDDIMYIEISLFRNYKREFDNSLVWNEMLRFNFLSYFLSKISKTLFIRDRIISSRSK